MSPKDDQTRCWFHYFPIFVLEVNVEPFNVVLPLVSHFQNGCVTRQSSSKARFHPVEYSWKAKQEAYKVLEDHEDPVWPLNLPERYVLFLSQLHAQILEQFFILFPFSCTSFFQPFFVMDKRKHNSMNDFEDEQQHKESKTKEGELLFGIWDLGDEFVDVLLHLLFFNFTGSRNFPLLNKIFSNMSSYCYKTHHF